MSALSPLASTPCLDIQTKSDQYLFYPTIYAGRKFAKLAPNLATAGFTDTIAIRLLLVAQSIVSLIALPFKMLVAIFSGIDAMISSEDPKSWLNLSYAMLSVGVHALTVPAGIVGACLSTEAIVKGMIAGHSVGESDTEEFMKRQAMSWLSAFGITPEQVDRLRRG